jgi:hypothetical protein
LLGFLVIALGLKLSAQQHQRGLFG